jgi:hypothetical protein
MNSRGTARFWRLYQGLPQPVRDSARKQFRLWKSNPRHGSVQFKQVKENLWSARITLGYRALATKAQDTWVWFWIGTHDEYDTVLK